MSLSNQLMRNAAAKAAADAGGKLQIEGAVAKRLAPIAVALILSGLKKNYTGPIGALAYSFSFDGLTEDVFNSNKHLYTAYIVARGQVIIERALKDRAKRAAKALALLAKIDTGRAALFLAMTAAAVVSALAKSKHELQLNLIQFQGVLKSETALIDGADPRLVREVTEWVYQPGPLMRATHWLISLTFPAQHAPDRRAATYPGGAAQDRRVLRAGTPRTRPIDRRSPGNAASTTQNARAVRP